MKPIGKLNFVKVSEFSRDSCLEFLSSATTANNWKSRKLSKINLYAKHLLPAILPEYRKKKTDFHSVVGLGGEAVVILAFDRICQRPTVFKIAFPDANLKGVRNVYHEKPGKTTVEHFNVIRERFIRGGAQIAGALSDTINRKHGVIPQIRSACDFPVFVEMEYLEGAFPISFFKEKTFSERFVFFYRLLCFVEIVHSYKIIHRDLKPTNILVLDTEEGFLPSILDWTFSKQMNFEDEKEPVLDLTRQSNMNFHIHSPCFSSPRLINGDAENADYQDDIYSLGQLMYCILTSTIPRGLKDFNTREKEAYVREKVFPVSELTPDIIEIYKKSTHIDEEQRYKIISEYLLDLRAFAAKMNIALPEIDQPTIEDALENTFDKFEGPNETHVNNTKEEKERIEKLIVDLTSFESEKAREMIRNLTILAKLASKYEIDFLERE